MVYHIQKSAAEFIYGKHAVSKLRQHISLLKSLSPSVSHTELAAPLVSQLSLSPQEALMPDAVPKRLGWVPWLLPHVCGSGTPPKPREDTQTGHTEEGGLCVLPHFRQSAN